MPGCNDARTRYKYRAFRKPNHALSAYRKREMGKLTKLTVYLPEARCAAIRGRAVRDNKSVSGYLQALIDQEQALKGDPVRGEISRLHKRLDEVLEFSRYIMVVQNATADRLSPGLMAEVQELYRKEFGGAPDAR